MLENLLNDDLVDQIQELFKARLIHPIMLLFFYSQKDCDYCEETGRLLAEITALSERIQYKGYNIDENQAIARQYHIQLTPGLVVAGNDDGEVLDYGIRFAGIPSGYEFGSLIQAMIMVSRRDSGLKPEVRQQLKDIKNPLHLQVFVTPT
jgi:alkyl hydroperoxide reductase subunit AhpF